MEKFDSVILINPNIGEYYGNNVFLRILTKDEIKFLQEEIIIEYRKKHNSYVECMKDLKDKLQKIKSILEG